MDKQSIPPADQPCNNRILVDWVSATIPLINEQNPTTLPDLKDDLARTFEHHFGPVSGTRPGSGPYRISYHASMTDERHHFTLYGRLGDDTALMEISGSGCEVLRQHGQLEEFLYLSLDTSTRLDIAIDFETSVAPSEFANTCTNDRIKTRSEITSPTGDTCYLGSRKSERFCRVYRYHEPHPRAKYLRIEMVLKKGLSKNAIGVILQAGLQEAADRAAATYRFSHPIYEHLGAASIQSYRPERDTSQTVRWFYTQVVPALNKLLWDGSLTLEEVVNAISSGGQRQP